MAKRSKKRARKGKTTRVPVMGKHIAAPRKGATEHLSGYRTVTANWKRMSTSSVRAMLAGSMDLVRDGLRVLLERYSHPMAALISLQDAAMLELLDAPENKQLKARLLRQLAKK